MADALFVAANAAQTIIARANRGGTDAVTYDGVRDAILSSLRPLRDEIDRLQTELEHLRSQAGADSCADYVARNRELIEGLREIEKSYWRDDCAAEDVAEFAYRTAAALLAKYKEG